MPRFNSAPVLNPGDSINRGLVGFWPLDAASGGIARDISQYRRHAPLTNFSLSSGSGWASAAPGRVLTFDGVNDHVPIPNIPPITRVSISALVRVPSGSPGFIVNKNYSSGVVPFSLCVVSSGTFGGMAFFDGGWRLSNVTTNITGDGKFHFVTGTYDGSTLKYFLDGKLDASASYSGSLPNNTHPLDIGVYRNDGLYYSGSIALLRVHSRALSLREIQRLAVDPWAGTLRRRRRAVSTTASAAYNETLSDAVTAGDAIAAALAALGSLTDALTAAEGLAAALAAAASASDAGTAADSPAAVRAALASLSDPATGADATSGRIAAGLSASDAATGGDAAAGGFAVSLSASDAATAADSLAAALGVSASLSDAATAADTLAAALSALAQATDATAAADLAGAVLAAAEALADALAAADAISLAGLSAPTYRTVRALLRARAAVARAEDRTITAPYRTRTISAEE